MNKRSVVSSALLFSLIMLPVSAVIVHVKHGMAASHTWLHLHTVFGIIFMTAGVCHAMYNWRALKKYFTGKT